MTVIEIILLIVGMIFILASFWVTEKLSPEELRHISELSKEEMGVMLERELEKSKQRVVDIVEDTIDDSKDRTERALEKQTNEKIMAINEFSDTVIEKINKTHNEIMFLYSMLNDKHTELTDFTTGLTQQLQDLKSQEEEMTSYYLNQLKNQIPQVSKPAAQPVEAAAAAAPAAAKPQLPANVPAPQESVSAEPEAGAAQVDAADTPEKEEDEVNVKDEILRLYEEGRDSVAIAKKLGLGVGEVRLILGLYKGD
ncbi:MAG: hypothetical protein K2P45_03400 [Eubacterium sp.]|nr:hypothetical protein [Eubacterium sp.]